MGIVLIIVVVAVVLTVVYFCPIQQNRYGERLYGRKHIQRAVTAHMKTFFPGDYESEEEVIERKEKSRSFTDHIIGATSLSEEEAWDIFNELFAQLEKVDLGDITLNLLDTNIILPHKKTTVINFVNQCTPVERIRYFLLRSNIPKFSQGSSNIFLSLTNNLNISGWYDEGEFYPIEGEPTPSDLERIEKLNNIQDDIEKEKEKELIDIRKKCDDIIDGKVIYDKERINTLITWVEEYDYHHSHLTFSKIKEVRTNYLNNAEENRKRLVGLNKKLNTIMH